MPMALNRAAIDAEVPGLDLLGASRSRGARATLPSCYPIRKLDAPASMVEATLPRATANRFRVCNVTSYEVCCRMRRLICRCGTPLRWVGRQAARALLRTRNLPDHDLVTVFEDHTDLETSFVESHGDSHRDELGRRLSRDCLSQGAGRDQGYAQIVCNRLQSAIALLQSIG